MTGDFAFHRGKQFGRIARVKTAIEIIKLTALFVIVIATCSGSTALWKIYDSLPLSQRTAILNEKPDEIENRAWVVKPDLPAVMDVDPGFDESDIRRAIPDTQNVRIVDSLKTIEVKDVRDPR